MTWTFFRSPEMAFTGQLFRQSRQPTHFSGIDVEDDQVLADAGGAGAVDDMGQVLVPEIAQRGQDGIGRRLTQAAEGTLLDRQGELLELPEVIERPFPAVILARISAIWRVPIRQGAHLPQDSSWVKRRK